MIKQCLFCEEEFEAHRASMKFCTPKHCTAYGNMVALQRYHERKANLHKKRNCGKCGKVLNKYNKSDNCYSCMSATEEEVEFKVCQL